MRANEASGSNEKSISQSCPPSSKVILIDGRSLANFMIDFNLGVDTQISYEIKKMDNDYFEEE